jgi:F0F1-type ATP synthase membrane subunit a
LTLAFRLLANILGGHLILELAGENSSSWLLIIGLRSYEVFVAVVQAIIFSILVYYYTLESLEKY